MLDVVVFEQMVVKRAFDLAHLSKLVAFVFARLSRLCAPVRDGEVAQRHEQLNALLSQPSVVHISDSLPPRLGDCCHKVLITSPDPDIWRWFVEKEGAVQACFPPYDIAEMEALLSLIPISDPTILRLISFPVFFFKIKTT